MDLYDHTGFEEIQSYHKDNPDKADRKEIPPVTEKEPTSFYCLEEEKGYFQQRLAYLIVALLVIAVLIMIGVMWLTI